jgi:hypothetical protein
MQEALGGNPSSDQWPESLPVQAGFLTAQAQLAPPESDNPPPEGTEGPHVAGTAWSLQSPCTTDWSH